MIVHAMLVRIRLPELLEQHDSTAYGIARDSKGRIQPSTLYRLARQRGRVKYFDSELLEALCDVLDVEPGELLEREGKRRGR
jgi:DNA-binding Xre family transcriptional regulator